MLFDLAVGIPVALVFLGVCGIAAIRDQRAPWWTADGPGWEPLEATEPEHLAPVIELHPHHLTDWQGEGWA